MVYRVVIVTGPSGMMLVLIYLLNSNMFSSPYANYIFSICKPEWPYEFFFFLPKHQV